MVGTLAMVWVGGGIILHGLEEFGVAAPAHVIHDLAHVAGAASGYAGPLVDWFVNALGGALVGLALGAVIVALLHLKPGKAAH